MHYIAIEGKGGSGKTYLSELLAKRLRCRVHHLDEYGNDFEPFVGIPNLLKAISTVGDVEVVVYEGVGVFKNEFDHLNAFKIFVDTADEVRKLRAESRDVPTDERSKEEWEEIYKIWSLAESEYFTEDVKTRAHFITPKDGEFYVDEIIEQFENYYSS